MTFRRRLLLYTVSALGLFGFIACMVAIIGLWIVSARLRSATEVVFAKIDGSLVAIQAQAERARDRVKESAISAESIAGSLREWTVREAGERIVLKVNVPEKTDRLLSVLQRADSLLELSWSSAEAVQQALITLSAIEVQIDTELVDVVIDEISALRSQLADVTSFVEKLRDETAVIGENEPPRERIEPMVQLALRAIATLSSIDSRLINFKTRLSATQKHLQALSAKTIGWIWIVSIAVTTLIIWMAAGQVSLFYLAWNGLRPARRATGSGPSNDRPPAA